MLLYAYIVPSIDTEIGTGTTILASESFSVDRAINHRQREGTTRYTSFALRHAGLEMPGRRLEHLSNRPYTVI